MAGKGKGREGGNIVIKKEEVVEGGHHGGAWKVAYADLVTAMMAFFLLMWLLNATTEEQRRGLADYFAPTNVMGKSQTGTGQPFGGRTVNSAGSMASDSGALRVERGPAPVRTDVDEEEAEGPSEAVPNMPSSAEKAPRAIGTTNGPPRPPAGASPLTAEQALTGAARAGLGGPTQAGEQQSGARRAGEQRPGDRLQGEAMRGEDQATEAQRLADGALRAELARRERAAFEQAESELRAAVRDDPNLAELARQLKIEQVPEGLRIQLLDADRQPMFPLASATPNDRARALIAKVAQVAARLPNPISIAGHTDSTPFRGGERTNWDLSADRANAVRRLLTDQGVNPLRLRGVTGMAEREPLLADDPGNAANRRVAITLIRQISEGAPAR